MIHLISLAHVKHFNTFINPSIVITSSEPGEGKSTTSGNLAIAISQGENKVLLVDCDMRKPSVHK